MIISYSHRFIFFHVAKVAGTSIRKALKDYEYPLEKFKIQRPLAMVNNKPNPMYEVWESFLMHVKAIDAKKELPQEFKEFFKFSFVRNPWDWQVSMYHFIMQQPGHIHSQKVRLMTCFEEYIEWVEATKNPFPKGATKLQSDMVTDENGNILVDFVGRYENLHHDLEKIANILHLDVSLPRLNSSQHKDYRSYYNKRSKDLVAKYFQKDIEIFGYHFE